MPSSVRCRNPANDIYACPLLDHSGVVRANEVALGYAGGRVEALKVRRTKEHASIVDCNCVYCCPCDRHAEARRMVDAEGAAYEAQCSTSPVAQMMTPTSLDAINAFLHAAPLSAGERPLLDKESKLPLELTELLLVKKEVGSGSYSTVWLCELRDKPQLPPEGTGCAVERATLEFLHGPLAAKRFLCLHDIDRVVSELSIAFRYGRLEHHMLPLLGVVRQPGFAVSMLMPYREHQPFAQRFHNMTLRQIQSYMRGLLTALSKLHQYNVVHRDVKPGQ